MKITLSDLEEFAKKFLEILDREQFTSTESLRDKVGIIYTYSVNTPDFVSVTLRPSNHETLAHTVSYIRPGIGIPIELKINTYLRYSQVILKAEKEIKGYSSFSTDSFGNILQYKILNSSELGKSREELRSLLNLAYIINK